MSVTDITHRPVGGDTRSVSEMLTNFDDLLDALNAPGLDGQNFLDGSLGVDKLADSLQDSVGLNDSDNSQRRAVHVAASEVVVPSPSGIAVNTVQLMIPATAAVLLCSMWQAKGTGAVPALQHRVTLGTINQSIGVEVLSTGYTWFSSGAIFIPASLGGTGLQTLNVMAVPSSGSSWTVKDRHLFAMIWDF